MERFPDPSWNDTDTAFPDQLCIHDLFEQQVVRTPDAVALSDGGHDYTYAKVDAMTNQLARLLIERGVTKDTVVGCYLSRSSAIVLCVIAILKAGGTYLLLDERMPDSRMEYIIEDAQPLLIIFDGESPHIRLDPAVQCLGLEECLRDSDRQDAGKVSAGISSENAAYIAYTSGSTGKPKGVIITHRATVNHACAFSRLLQLGPSDRVPMMAPIAFDMAIEEMIPPLMSGCRLLISKPYFISMEDLNEDILTHGYTILNIPAPLWEQWTEYLDTNQKPVPPSLRVVIAGSEEIETKSLMTWKRINGSDTVRWVAAYGTTETTVTSTLYTAMQDDDLSGESTVPIGKPIANTYTYVLNDELQPVPVGKEGELYIGGEGLARGYKNMDGLTKKKFIPNPFRSEEGARMYKTGDLVRYRPDGSIVWLGRADSQIKLFGLRIEPGDVESVLSASPLVKEAIVVLQRWGNKESDKHLVAFVTTEHDQEFSESELRQLVFRHLPSAMSPDRYMQLTSFPLNPNGKIDRNALEQRIVDVDPSVPKV